MPSKKTEKQLLETVIRQREAVRRSYLRKKGLSDEQIQQALLKKPIKLRLSVKEIVAKKEANELRRREMTKVEIKNFKQLLDTEEPDLIYKTDRGDNRLAWNLGNGGRQRMPHKSSE